MTEVVVVPHDPNWRDLFADESKLIAEALGQNVVAINHIGSTSIPGIYAKPVIDILIDVTDIDEVDAKNLEMQSLGYEVMGEFGIEGRRYFRKENNAGVRTHHIHAFETGSPQIARHLAFRDYMIAHPDKALAYSELKQTLAVRNARDPDGYMDGKDEFIKETDRLAEQWRLVT